MPTIARGRRSIPPPYYTGEQLLAMYTRDISGGTYTADQIRLKYGKKPWFLKHPTAAPPYSAFKIAAEDTRGRGYNFPSTDSSAVHVRLPKARARRTENRAAELPVVGEVISLTTEEQEFKVLSVDTGGRKNPNTAILHVEWFF
jgi:hypothetical protein